MESIDQPEPEATPSIYQVVGDSVQNGQYAEFGLAPAGRHTDLAARAVATAQSLNRHSMRLAVKFPKLPDYEQSAKMFGEIVGNDALVAHGIERAILHSRAAAMAIGEGQAGALVRARQAVEEREIAEVRARNVRERFLRLRLGRYVINLAELEELSRPYNDAAPEDEQPDTAFMTIKQKMGLKKAATLMDAGRHAAELAVTRQAVAEWLRQRSGSSVRALRREDLYNLYIYRYITLNDDLIEARSTTWLQQAQTDKLLDIGLQGRPAVTDTEVS